MLYIGVDVGGTFTDIVVFDSENAQVDIIKVPTNRERPEGPVLEALAEASAKSALRPTKEFSDS